MDAKRVAPAGSWQPLRQLSAAHSACKGRPGVKSTIVCADAPHACTPAWTRRARWQRNTGPIGHEHLVCGPSAGRVHRARAWSEGRDDQREAHTRASWNRPSRRATGSRPARSSAGRRRLHGGDRHGTSEPSTTHGDGPAPPVVPAERGTAREARAEGQRSAAGVWGSSLTCGSRCGLLPAWRGWHTKAQQLVHLRHGRSVRPLPGHRLPLFAHPSTLLGVRAANVAADPRRDNEVVVRKGRVS